jgi:acyl-CoA thioesterase-1
MAAAYGLQGRLRKVVAALLALGAAAVLLAVPAMASPIRLLVLGDSLTAGHDLPYADGFQAQLAAALGRHGRQVQITDGAVSGDTTEDGSSRLAWALGGGADAAIVELGANDGLRGIDPKVMEANLIAILDTLAARHIPVLLCGMYAPPNMGSDYEAAFKAVFERLSRRPGVLFDPFFLAGVAEDPRYTLPDREHPNAEGVTLIVKRLLPLVDKLLAAVKTG